MKAIDAKDSNSVEYANNAMIYMGLINEYGYEDMNTAFAWYQKAADLGDDYAMYRIGLLYEKGKGVTIDYKTALEWYQKAADLENERAMYRIGLFYEDGYGVKQNKTLAYEWYQRASDLGDDDAYNKIRSNKITPTTSPTVASPTPATVSPLIMVYSEDDKPIGGALIYIDGELIAISDKRGFAQLLDFVKGTYSLKIVHDGYVSASMDVNFNDSKGIAVILNYANY